MSNAAAAYYAYLAYADRERARVFRNFGYHASADYVERRADRYDAQANREAKTTRAATFDGAALGVSLPADSHDDGLHTTSDGDEQTGLFAKQEP